MNGQKMIQVDQSLNHWKQLLVFGQDVLKSQQDIPHAIIMTTFCLDPSLSLVSFDSISSIFKFWMIEIILIKITHDEILVLEKSWSRYQLPEINHQLLINYFKWFILDFSRCTIILRPFPTSWHNRSSYFPYWHVLYPTWINPSR